MGVFGRADDTGVLGRDDDTGVFGLFVTDDDGVFGLLEFVVDATGVLGLTELVGVFGLFQEAGEVSIFFGFSGSSGFSRIV